MTVLSALQSASVRLTGEKPATFFSSQSKFEMQMVDIVNDAAKDIARSHEWRALTKTATITGDGVTTSFAIPADYDRMALAQSVHDKKSWLWNYTPCPDLDTWISILNGQVLAAVPGWWIILDGAFQIYPAPSGVANYPYISNAYSKGDNGDLKQAFDRDDDSYRLSEDLLIRKVRWMWKEMMGFDATNDQAEFLKLFSELSARDPGSRVIRSSDSRDFRTSGWPYPFR